MINRTSSWLYVAGGAVIGLAAVGALARRKLLRTSSASPELGTGRGGARARHYVRGDLEEPTQAPDDEQDSAESRLGDAVSDLPAAVREAIDASARSHGARRVPEALSRAIAERAEDRRPHPGNTRHEVSSLVPPHAIAADRDGIGDELVDAGAIEVPIGRSADDAIDRALDHDKLPQAESTAGVLARYDSSTGVHDEFTPGVVDRPEGFEFTAQSLSEPTLEDDAYDAVAPDDLGSEYLARATESAGGSVTDREVEPPELFLESGMSVVSESSYNAASADQLELDVASALEGSDEDLEEAPLNPRRRKRAEGDEK